MDCLGAVEVNASAPISFPIQSSLIFGKKASGGENGLSRSHSTFHLEIMASETLPLLLRTQRFGSPDNCCTKYLDICDFN